MRTTERDVTLADGGTLRVHDTAPGDPARPVVVWHHGTPNTGIPPLPLGDLTDELGLRWVSWDRPGYGGSSPHPGRDVASAASYAEEVTAALGIGEFAVMGHSGGGPHALACAALLPDRVTAALAVSGVAPLAGFDWTDGMCASGVAALDAATQGREARLAWEETYGASYDPEFTPGDLEVLAGEWSWFGDVVRAAEPSGPGPAVDDDVALAAPWGCDLADVRAPTLLLHGDADRVVPLGHSRRVASLVATAELRVVPGAGHLSVMRGAADALRWLVARAAEAGQK